MTADYGLGPTVIVTSDEPLTYEQAAKIKQIMEAALNPGARVDVISDGWSIQCLTSSADHGALRELHDAIVEYLAGFDYPTRGAAWQRLQRASADAAVVLRLDGRFGDFPLPAGLVAEMFAAIDRDYPGAALDAEGDRLIVIVDETVTDDDPRLLRLRAASPNDGSGA